MVEHDFDLLTNDLAFQARTRSVAVKRIGTAVLGRAHRWRHGTGTATAKRGKLRAKRERGDCCGGAIGRRGLCACAEGHKAVAGFCAGTFGRLGNGQGEFDFPVSVATARIGVIYACDLGTDRVQRFAPV
jgi:hypothetical protein